MKRRNKGEIYEAEIVLLLLVALGLAIAFSLVLFY